MKFTHQVIYGENHRFPEPEDVVSEKMVKATKNNISLTNFDCGMILFLTGTILNVFTKN